MGNDIFWNFAVHELRQKFPKRNDSLQSISEFVMPKRLEEMLESLKENLASFVKPDFELLENELSDFSGFIEDVKKKEGEIEDRMRNKITENKDIQSLVEQLERSILVWKTTTFV